MNFYLKTYEGDYFKRETFPCFKQALKAFKNSPLKKGKLVVCDQHNKTLKSRNINPWNHWFIKLI